MAHTARRRGSVRVVRHCRRFLATQAGIRQCAGLPVDRRRSRRCVPVTRRQPWSVEQVRALGATTDIVTAGAVLGIGRTTAYRLARLGAFPVPLLKVGSRYVVAVAHL